MFNDGDLPGWSFDTSTSDLSPIAARPQLPPVPNCRPSPIAALLDPVGRSSPSARGLLLLERGKAV
jgi:hypothetical protein